MADHVPRFRHVPTERLALLAEDLGKVYAEDHTELRVAQFARTLSVMMRCELARRAHDEASDV